jgi:CBS domain containing-hemolysin-like protein
MKTKTSIRWLIKIVIISVAVSMVFTLTSSRILGHAGYILAFVVLVIFISLGIVFDMIGIAVTVAAEAPFHSMAARHKRGAADSLRLIKNADKVSSFCNDVVGDVTGIISGTITALIAARLMEELNTENLFFSLIISGMVTGLIVGGKAVGKTIAINNSTNIVLRIGKLISVFRLNNIAK